MSEAQKWYEEVARAEGVHPIPAFLNTDRITRALADEVASRDLALQKERAELADLRARLARVVAAAREYRKRQRAGGACDAEITKRMAEKEWEAADALDAVLAEEVRRG